MLKVEVIYIPQDKPAVHIQVDAKSGATVAEVIEQSGIKEQYPEVEILPAGVFAKKVTLDTPVRSGDRIEIYRPLKIDPKEKRRERAGKQIKAK